MLSALLLCVSHSHFSATAPIQNITALRTETAPAWVPGPSGRGTGSVLYSCVFTLGLCVWTALHLNIPPHGEGSWARWLRKVKWLLIALFAPEVVLYTAWYQFYHARLLVRRLNKLDQPRAPNECCSSDSAISSWYQFGRQIKALKKGAVSYSKSSEAQVCWCYRSI